MRLMVAGLVDAGDAMVPVVPSPDPRDRATADQKVRDAREAQCMRKHHIDRKAVGKDSHARRLGLRRGGIAKSLQHPVPKPIWFGAKVADRILQKARPGFAPSARSVSVE